MDKKKRKSPYEESSILPSALPPTIERRHFKLDRNKTIYFFFTDASGYQVVETEVVSNSDTNDGVDIQLTSQNSEFNFTIPGKITQETNGGEIIYLLKADFNYNGKRIQIEGYSNQHWNSVKRWIFGKFQRSSGLRTDNGGYGGGNNGV